MHTGDCFQNFSMMSVEVDLSGFPKLSKMVAAVRQRCCRSAKRAARCMSTTHTVVAPTDLLPALKRSEMSLSLSARGAGGWACAAEQVEAHPAVAKWESSHAKL